MHPRKAATVLCLLLFSLLLLAAGPTEPDASEKVRAYYLQQLDSLDRSLAAFESRAMHAEAAGLQADFVQARALYKRVEFLVEYCYPATANRINGAPLLEAEPSEPNEPMHPSGFQVLEEFVFDSLTAPNRRSIVRELSTIRFEVRNLQGRAAALELSAALIFDALRLNLYRLIAKGISGFDVPVALSSISEAATTIESSLGVLRCYAAPEALLTLGQQAADFAAASGNDFAGFDRAAFLADFLNPFMRELRLFQEKSGVPATGLSAALRAGADSPFSPDAFDLLYFAPAGTEAPSAEMAALGKVLFYDPLLSANGKRSCGSCHQPDKAFTDGLAVNESLLGQQRLLRNTPTLYNAALQPVQFADSRITFLEDQVHVVVSDRHEMGGDFAKIVDRLRRKKSYNALFAAAFPGEKDARTEAAVRTALAGYVRSLVALDAPFDRYMRGDKTAMNRQQLHGFNLFMGKAKCGTCHYAPLFSGAVPPLYDKMESEVLGVPANTDTLHPVLDSDEGKYNLYRMPHQRHSFKTTGLRNSAITPPYMHNGVYKTLEEVLAFYNRGGGAGMGLDVPNQTLSPDPLNLSQAEQQDIIAFLHTLTDTVVSGHRQTVSRAGRY